jgi:DNA-binding response OmpR family regulator
MAAGYPLRTMAKILVVADVAWVVNEVHAALTDPAHELVDHRDPATAADTALDEFVDVVVVDLQVGAMGGMAVTRSVRDATATADDPGMPVVLLLDRSADVFLARRAGAAAWVVKPFTSQEMETAVSQALDRRSPFPVASDQE